MTLKEGDYVERPGFAEPLLIEKITRLGSNFSVRFRGYGDEFFTAAALEALKVVGGNEYTFRGDPGKFKLFAEAERIAAARSFDPLFALNCSVVDALPHQVEAVYKYMLPQPRLRFLLADDTGAGKTIMAGLFIKELLLRGNVSRVLVVTPGGLTKQWKEDELGAKFDLDFKLVNREIFSAEPTVFRDEARVVTSVDFISRDDVLAALQKAPSWDLVVFDEAHKLSAYRYGSKTHESKRYKAAQVLAGRSTHLLLLTATPHRGRADTFTLLMQLLDKDIFATEKLTTERVQESSANGANRFFIRRLKEKMKDWNGAPLYKKRFTRTVSYELTAEEDALYRAVTDYLRPHKHEAEKTNNLQVSLALQVVQRRLASSIYAVTKTLEKRSRALSEFADMLERTAPALLRQKARAVPDASDEIFSIDSLADFDELDDADREKLLEYMTDPKKMRLFTTAGTVAEIRAEALEVEALFKKADALRRSGAEEQKYVELKKLLREQNVAAGKKIVVFTEYKDTLDYLRERLSNDGFTVATIHGAMSVDERREAQCKFASRAAQILVCTDAAGEGINLQFCSLLVNWDIPWNPNRLEQRMGRIHRYGQKNDVFVFNIVAGKTQEGRVLKTLLSKLEKIREQLGSDRVYDVIQDVLKGVPLSSVISAIADGKENELTRYLAENDEESVADARRAIAAQDRAVVPVEVNYNVARRLKQESESRCVQPLYVKQFFSEALETFGCERVPVPAGRVEAFKISTLPKPLADTLAARAKIHVAELPNQIFFFDKRKFLASRFETPALAGAQYVNPGNPIFDGIVDFIRKNFALEAEKGTVLVDPAPDVPAPTLAFLVKNKVLDGSRAGTVVAESLELVRQTPGTEKFSASGPAKFLDFADPAALDMTVPPPAPLPRNSVPVGAVYDCAAENLLALRNAVQKRVADDLAARREFVEESFNEQIFAVTGTLNDLQGKTLFSNGVRLETNLAEAYERLEKIKKDKAARLSSTEFDAPNFSPAAPEILGCAYIVPAPAKIAVPDEPADAAVPAEFNESADAASYGNFADVAARRAATEAVAMQVVMDFERAAGRTPFDCSKENCGYDVESRAPDGSRRCIEVKGRASVGEILLSENEYKRLSQLGDDAWLYVVFDCNSPSPRLRRFRDPIRTRAPEVFRVSYCIPLEKLQQ